MTATAALASTAAHDPVLARMRAAHLKSTADTALAAGNAGDAARAYEAAAAALPPGAPPAERARLASNASLAWLRAGRAGLALTAAEAAVSSSPGWDKAHWRRAAALAGSGRHAEALAALRACAAAGGHPPACRAAACRSAARLPRRDVARCVLSLLEDGVARGAWPASRLGDGGAGQALAVCNSGPRPPSSSAALALLPDVRCAGPAPTAAAVLAAAERLVAVGEGRAAEEGLAGEGEAAAERQPSSTTQPCTDAPPPPPSAAGAASSMAGHWRESLAAWMLDPATLHPAVALAERSAIDAEAGGWSAALADARAAVAAATGAAPAIAARAHLRLGEALLAAPGIPGRDCASAAAAASAGLACLGPPPPPPLAREAAKASKAAESPADQEARRLRAGLAAVLRGSEAGLPTGAVGDAVRGGRSALRLSIRFRPPCPRSLGPAARARLVGALAKAVGCPDMPCTAVTLEGVLRGGDGSLTVRVAVSVGEGGAACVRAAAAGLALEEGGPAPEVAVEPEEAAEETLPDLSLVPPASTALTALPAPPPRARLTTAAGAPLDGPPRSGGGTATRHPFRLSRIHYSSRDLPPDAWVELPDGRVRWRQSAGEVRVIVAAVPPGARPADISVAFRPRRVRVSAAGQLLWDARLARHIVPSESTWTYGGGQGEDGLVLGLAKANLEVLAAGGGGGGRGGGGGGGTASPADTWWPVLTRPRKGEEVAPAHTGAVAWDDYDKDYSDAPHCLLAAAAASEAAAAVERSADAAERAEREACAREDEARVRARAERLDAMRGAIVQAAMG